VGEPEIAVMDHQRWFDATLPRDACSIVLDLLSNDRDSARPSSN